MNRRIKKKKVKKAVTNIALKQASPEDWHVYRTIGTNEKVRDDLKEYIGLLVLIESGFKIEEFVENLRNRMADAIDAIGYGLQRYASAFRGSERKEAEGAYELSEGSSEAES